MKQLLVLGDLRTAQGDEVWMQEDYPKMNAILGGLQAYYTVSILFAQLERMSELLY